MPFHYALAKVRLRPKGATPIPGDQYMSESKSAHELKPCPFCQAPPDLGGYDFAWYVRCTNDECWARANGSLYEDADAAIAAWNRRSIDHLSARVRELEEALDAALPVLKENYRFHRDIQSDARKVAEAYTVLEKVRVARRALSGSGT